MNPNPNTRPVTTRVLAGAAAAVGAVALVAVPLTVSAQDDDGDGRGGWANDALDDLVEEGTVTQAQADAVEQALADARPERGPGRGIRRDARDERRGERFATVAEVLGLDPEVVRDALRDGRTIAELATEQGVEVQAVIDALVAEATERITTFVNEGHPAVPAAPADDETTTTTEPAPTTTQG